METKHARMLEFGIGDPTQFGHLPDRNYLRHLKHQGRLDLQVNNIQETPREILGVLLGLIAETGRLSSRLKTVANDQRQNVESEESAETTVKVHTQERNRDRRSNTEKVYGVNGSRWNRVHRTR